MPPAARITDMHVCPMVTGIVPHVGGPVMLGCPTVIIGFLPAARVNDVCICVGPPDMIAMGSLTVKIGGMPAARLGDMTMHGGNIVMGCPTVIIGDVGMGSAGAAAAAGGVGAAAPASPTTDEETIQQAIDKIRNSDFGQTEEGQRVVEAAERLQREGKIRFGDLGDETRGQWSGRDGITVNSSYNRDVDATASEIAHEATHEVDNGEHPNLTVYCS